MVSILLILAIVMAAVTSGCGPTGYEVGHAHSEFCAGSTITVENENGMSLDVPATLCVMVLTVDSGNGETETVGCTMVVDSPVGTGYLPEPMSHARCSEAPGFRPFRVGLNLNVGSPAVLRTGYESAGSNGDSGNSGESVGPGVEDRGSTIDESVE